ncbi:hypothetical protein F443_00024 [Phytophthora nicotianae P1569]|uniref:Uncharacterized protein n=2 Tax=Phytophthora nicotianae TaxID=4792 RepID=V9G361_PHYNI|nr:hypothetical protein F443_00024 [Phytophthora nicotianae P1569]ETO59244.1 hypothetical protein F444_22384 [Phytophthora nicotianae P1976]
MACFAAKKAYPLKHLTSGENDLGPVFAIQRRTTWGRGETGQQCIERWE